MDHEIKLVATLDTSNINTNTGTTGATTNRTTSSGGSTTSAFGTALVGGQLGSVGNALSLQMSKAIKSFIESLSKGIQLINHQLHRLSLPLYEIVKEFNLVNRDINGMSESFGKFTDRYLSSLQNSIAVADDFTKSLNELSNSTNKASNEIKNSFNSLSIGKSGASGITGLLGKKIGNGGGFGELFGRMVGVGAVMSAYSGTRQIFDITDPQRKTTTGKIFDWLEWINPFSKMASEAEKASELVKQSKERLDRFNNQLARFNEAKETANLDRYSSEQKGLLDGMKESELPKYISEHSKKLENLKKKYEEMNKTLANGDVPLFGLDKFLKQMGKLANELNIEQQLFDTASEKMKKLNDEVERLAEETEKLNREFSNQKQSISDTRDSEKRAQARRGWDSMSMGDLLIQKSGIDKMWNNSNSSISSIDAKISALQKEYQESDYTNEDKRDIIDEINELTKQRGRLSGVRNEALGDLDRINGLMKAFDDATKTLNEKAQDLRNSEALSQWKEGLKYLNGSEMTRQLKEAKDRRAELYQSILNDYEKAAGTRNPESRRKLNDRIEFQLKQMSGLDNRISELKSRTKMGFDSPDDAMTDMGRMGMYMSNAESVLTDPKLQKLDHISMTLWKIERNTQNQVVSRFL